MKTTSKILALSALALGLLASAAQADIVTQHYTATSTLTDWSKTATFGKFDTGLGTLISVSFTLDTSIATTLTVTNTSGSSSSGSVRTEVFVALNDPSNNFGFYVPTPPGDVVGNSVSDLLTGTQSYSLTAGQSKTLTQKTATSNATYDYFDGATLTEFSGPGSIDLTLNTFTTTLLSNSGGNTNSSQVTNASGLITLVYTYDVTAIPEPATYAAGFGVIALLGAMVIRRRQK